MLLVMDLSWRFFNRPFKPVALGISIIMIVLCISGIANTGLLTTTIWGDIVSVLSGATALLLFVGWYTRSQRLAEIGLLSSTFVFVTVFSFLLLTVSTTQTSIWISLGYTVVAGGSYLLEKEDQRHHTEQGE